MAKKSRKNIQKLLKKKQLQQLRENTNIPALEPAIKEDQPTLKPKPEMIELPAGEGKPVIKTVVISAVIILVIFGVAYWSKSTNYLETFGNWLYESLKLSDV